jgi:hypothetical protein
VGTQDPPDAAAPHEIVDDRPVLVELDIMDGAELFAPVSDNAEADQLDIPAEQLERRLLAEGELEGCQAVDGERIARERADRLGRSDDGDVDHGASRDDDVGEAMVVEVDEEAVRPPELEALGRGDDLAVVEVVQGDGHGLNAIVAGCRRRPPGRGYDPAMGRLSLALAAVLAAAVSIMPAMDASGVVVPVGPPHLSGLQVGVAPWPAEWPHLAQRLRAIGLPALSAEGEVVHIHQHLDVRVHRRRVVVPAGVGFGIGRDGEVHFIAPVHTHATDGIIHVESPIERQFTLGDVFDVWGVRFSATCLGGYCARGGDRLRVFVNGRLVTGDPRAVTLISHEEIVVAFGRQDELPASLPASFAFADGL